MWHAFILYVILATFYEIRSDAIEVKGEGVRAKYTDANQTLHRLINNGPIDNFILISPRYSKNINYFMILFVISAQNDTAERLEIRNQWASENSSNLVKERKVLVIFLVGRSPNLGNEAAMYADILQVDIEETYRNLVYKIEAGFLWLKKNVKSDFVAKIDSDAVVHIDRLHREMGEHQHRSNNFLVCSISWAEPNRDEYSQRYTSSSDFPGSKYPRFCEGSGYVMSRMAFENIVFGMAKCHVIEVEDVFFTGIVGENVVQHVFVGNIATEYTEYSDCPEGSPVLSILSTDGQFNVSNKAKDLTAAWKTLKEPICTKAGTIVFTSITLLLHALVMNFLY